MQRTKFYLMLLLAFGWISNSCAQTHLTHKKMEKQAEKEQKAVLHTIENMVIAFHNKDIEGVLACYDKEATILFEPQKPIVGLENIKKAFLMAFEINPHYKFQGYEIYVMGNTATHTAPWTMTGTLPDGTTISQSGLSIAVLQKQANGTWLIVFDNPHGQFLMNK